MRREVRKLSSKKNREGKKKLEAIICACGLTDKALVFGTRIMEVRLLPGAHRFFKIL